MAVLNCVCTFVLCTCKTEKTLRYCILLRYLDLKLMQNMLRAYGTQFQSVSENAVDRPSGTQLGLFVNTNEELKISRKCIYKGNVSRD